MALRSREASPQKRRADAAPGPYNQMIRRLAGRMRQLQDELALESVTNIEFEEASRRSFDVLTSQVKSLKDAFNTLTDTLLEELDSIGSKVDEKLNKFTANLREDIAGMQVNKGNTELMDKLSRDIDAVVGRMQRLEADRPSLQLSLNQLTHDMDTVLGVVPKLEDKIDSATNDMAKISESLSERMVNRGSVDENRLRNLETELREDFEQRHLKLQRSITRQLESMSKVLAEVGSPQGRRVDFAMPQSPGRSLTASLSRAAEDGSRPSSLRNLRLS
eukprot:TRINITY_DN8263_c0_g1_i2.p1 TRINITY_DN8263_c0_g1~~TRINITY_DN8263_c0_g1_i2.p1  ORF type:complete len:276 (-),score=90.21 TRINITY_DN8263_c0_g1_i2:287-1114(-)